jgi:hypothetical protein
LRSWFAHFSKFSQQPEQQVRTLAQESAIAASRGAGLMPLNVGSLAAGGLPVPVCAIDDIFIIGTAGMASARIGVGSYNQRPRRLLGNSGGEGRDRQMSCKKCRVRGSAKAAG